MRGAYTHPRSLCTPCARDVGSQVASAHDAAGAPSSDGADGATTASFAREAMGETPKPEGTR
eukprot:3284892-Rhodomonas_salina.2